MRGMFIGLIAIAAAASADAQPTLNVRPQAPANTPTLTPEQAAQVVMFRTARDADSDLRDMLAAVRETNAHKQAMRQNVAALRAQQRALRGTTLPPNPCRGANFASWRQCLDRTSAKLAGIPQVERRDIDAEIAALRAQLTAAREADQASVDFQPLLDRLSRLSAMVSDVLRRMSETEQAIIQNIK